MVTHLDLPLYALDHDQTYDLLYYANIHSNIMQYLTSIKNFPSGTSNRYSYSWNRGEVGVSIDIFLSLFDRRTPDGYLWTKSYTTKLFNFFKPLTTTGYYSNSTFSGNGIGLNSFFPEIPPINHTQNLGDFLYSKLFDNSHPNYTFGKRTIQNTTRETIYLTWFSPAFIENNQPLRQIPINYNQENGKFVALPTYGIIYNKKAVRLEYNESTVIDEFCLLCSLVISNSTGEINSLDEQLPNYYFFKNFDTIFNQLNQEIREGFRQLGNYAWQYHGHYTTNDFFNEGADDPNDIYDDTDIDTFPELYASPPLREYVDINKPVTYPGYNAAIAYRSITYSPVPIWYYFASLIYGDEELTDLGKPLKLEINEIGNLEIKYWEDYEDLIHLRPIDEQYSGTFLERTIDLLPEEEAYEAIIVWKFDFTEIHSFRKPIEIAFEPNYYEFFKTYIDNVLSKLNPETQESQNDFMPDSQRVKEIHQALNAGYYAYYTQENEVFSRVANLGYYIERIARILGISVEPDGGIRSIRQSKHVPQGQSIPAGWAIAQWGRNDGASEEGQKGGNEGEHRDGIAYDVISNRFTTNPYTGEPNKIQEGGYVLCENLIQYLETLKDDIDKALGLQVAAANALPSADGKNYITYEGLHTLLAESVYMQSAMSEQQLSTLISSISTQAIVQEILAAMGMPCKVKEIKAKLAGENLKIPYPGVDSDAPTLFNQFSALLLNLSTVVLAITQISAKEQLVDSEKFPDQYPELVADNLDQIFDFSVQEKEE